MKRHQLGILAAGLVLATPLQADEFADAAMGLCEKVKSCAMQQMAMEDLTPEVRQMMEPMLEGMCASMQARIGEVPTGHPYYEPSLACMRSLESLSCENMEDPNSMQTPACEKYQALIKQPAAE